MLNGIKHLPTDVYTTSAVTIPYFAKSAPLSTTTTIIGGLKLNFCTKCGNKIIDGTHFCTSCGNDLREGSTIETESDHNIDLDTVNPELDYDMDLITTKPGDNATSHLKFSKKTKIFMSISIVLIILIVIIVNIGNSLSDPSKIVKRFEKDISSNNASDLASILYCNDSRLKVDSKSISPLLAYFKSNPTYYDKVDQDLKNNAYNPKDIDIIKLVNTLTLSSDGKTFLIFPKYKIYIKPSFIAVTAPVKGVTFSINNTNIGESDSDNSTKEFGPYIPGAYTILANYKNSYVSSSTTYPLDLVTADNNIAKVNVLEDMKYINISSDTNYNDAEVFVNGKNVNVKVKDATHFGPINNSSQIYATLAQGGKKLTSKNYKGSSFDTDLALSFEEASSELTNVKDKLNILLSQYNYAFVDAINNNNPAAINSYVASGSQLYKLQEGYILSTAKSGIQETFISSYITNFNSISDDNKSGSFTSSESYIIYSKDGLSTPRTQSYVYGFQYNDASQTYQLTSIN
ncbi:MULTISPECIES: zinc ribbon domain-containing protein [Clostridium]|uniref:Zinc-ribbon domain-containing protein n=1 Tax=Clostridium frigoriphilum TaxID=443253 RepID=A0ABU7UV64_9CLOT|nr:zinc-ribbon domain-containing protein [Clostridium sp. DSM 17811]MBU3101522.1 zinc-ribbon domain-containing protein [Clostridium sp. DSM 17811]